MMSDERSSDIKSSYANKVDKRKYKKRESPQGVLKMKYNVLHNTRLYSSIPFFVI